MVDGATYTMAHDVRGRITTALNLDLTYDNNNRLAVADTGAIQEYYLYDATGAMVARGDDEGGFEQFAYDGQHMIGAYEQGIAKWEATYTSGQDQMIGFYDYVGGADLVPIRDWRNNVVSAFDMTTQTALGHAEYSPEGRITSNVNGAQPCVEEGTGAICALPGGMPFAFNGQWRSDKTGLTYMRNRWYSARLGQFVTTDPLHYIDSVNQYAFVGFDPINAWDPWGLGADDLSWNTFIPAQRDYWLAKKEQDQRRAEERAAQRRSTPKINDISQVGIGALKSAAVGAGAVACARRHPGCGLLLVGLLDMENENSIPNVLVPANEDQAIGMLTIDLWIGVFALSKIAPAEAVATLTKDKIKIPIDELVDLTEHRSEHILNRHRFGTGKSGKTEFPADWSDDEILHFISDVATDPNSIETIQRFNTPSYRGMRDGVEIRVDFFPADHPRWGGKISTGFPVNVPPNK